MSDLTIPQSWTGLLRSKPWRTLAMVVGEIGSVWGIGISMGTSTSGERNGRGSGEEVWDEGM